MSVFQDPCTSQFTSVTTVPDLWNDGSTFSCESRLYYFYLSVSNVSKNSLQVRIRDRHSASEAGVNLKALLGEPLVSRLRVQRYGKLCSHARVSGKKLKKLWTFPENGTQGTGGSRANIYLYYIGNTILGNGGMGKKKTPVHGMHRRCRGK